MAINVKANEMAKHEILSPFEKRFLNTTRELTYAIMNKINASNILTTSFFYVYFILRLT